MRKRFLKSEEKGIVLSVGAESASQRAFRDLSETRPVTQWLIMDSMFTDGEDFTIGRKAKCALGHDDFSERKGKTIAGARADLAFHSRMAEGSDRSIAELEKAIAEAQRQKMRHLAEARHAQEVLHRLGIR